MVDCVDHITLRLNEWLLEPLQRLRDLPSPSTVSVRPPGRGRRVHVEIIKNCEEGPERAPSYRWSASDPAKGATTSAVISTGETAFDDPLDAYWAAVDAIAVARGS